MLMCHLIVGGQDWRSTGTLKYRTKLVLMVCLAALSGYCDNPENMHLIEKKRIKKPKCEQCQSFSEGIIDFLVGFCFFEGSLC